MKGRRDGERRSRGSRGGAILAGSARWVLGALAALCLWAGGAEVRGEMITCAGSGSNLETIRLMGQAFQGLRPDVRVEVLPSIGSGGGVKAAAAGKVDIGLAARPRDAGESDLPVHFIPYAMTPLVFAVSDAVKDDAITIEVVSAVYSGQLRRWADGTAIRPVLRPRHDSDTLVLLRAFPELVPSIELAYGRRGVPVAGVDQANLDFLENGRGMLGTATLGALKAERRRLKVLSLNGIAPTLRGLQEGAYPLSKTLYFVVPEKPRRAVQDFIDFVFSGYGAQILRETEHLPVPRP